MQFAILTFGTGGWLVEPSREKLLKLSRISFATCNRLLTLVPICQSRVAIQTSVARNDFSHLDNVVDKVSPHVTKVVESLLRNLPIIRLIL